MQIIEFIFIGSHHGWYHIPFTEFENDKTLLMQIFTVLYNTYSTYLVFPPLFFEISNAFLSPVTTNKRGVSSLSTFCGNIRGTTDFDLLWYFTFINWKKNYLKNDIVFIFGAKLISVWFMSFMYSTHHLVCRTVTLIRNRHRFLL